jgi:hypothetical protein
VAAWKSEDIQQKPQDSFTTTIKDSIASFAMNHQWAHDIAEKAKETEALVGFPIQHVQTTSTANQSRSPLY